MRWSQKLLAAAIMAIVAMFGPQAIGIDRYVFQPLPHLGFGGRAENVYNGDSGTFEQVIGHIYGAGGTRHAALWRFDDVGEAGLTLLPEFGGPSSYCWDFDYNEAAGIVGSAQDTNGTWQPVIWTDDGSGNFTIHQLPTLGGVGGEARGIFLDGGNDSWNTIVGSSRTMSGQMHATLWREISPGVWMPFDLGTGGGLTSHARAIVGDPGGGFKVVGSAQRTGGATHAFGWDLNNDGQIVGSHDRHPGGVTSGFFDIFVGDEAYACGTLTRQDGGSSGFFDIFVTDDPWVFQSPGFGNTSANSIFTHEFGHIVAGSAWNDTNDRHGVLWYTVGAFYDWLETQPAALFANHPEASDASINDVARGVIVGSFFDVFAELPYAALSDGTHMPDRAEVLLGLTAGKADPTLLWHEDDGRFLRARPRKGGIGAAAVGARFYGFFDIPSELRLTTRVRVAGSDKPTALMVMQVYNFSTKNWDTVAIESIDHWDSQSCSFASSNHVNPTTGEVRTRLVFTRLSGNVTSYDTELLMLD